MNYAIIQAQGKQYKVIEGKEILVDRIGKTEKQITFPEVLLIRTDTKILVGNPYVKKGIVAGKFLEEVKGEKIRVSKFKAKVRYNKTIGFRPIYSRVLIEKITVDGKKISDNKKEVAESGKEKKKARK